MMSIAARGYIADFYPQKVEGNVLNGPTPANRGGMPFFCTQFRQEFKKVIENLSEKTDDHNRFWVAQPGMIVHKVVASETRLLAFCRQDWIG